MMGDLFGTWEEEKQEVKMSTMDRDTGIFIVKW